MISLQTLASGSSGNMTLIRSDHSALVLDLGIRSKKGTLAALEGAGIGFQSLEAVLVSHSHSDHLGLPGLKVCREAGVPLLAGRETLDQATRLYPWNGNAPGDNGAFVDIGPGTTYLVGDIEVTPFAVSHDVPTYGFVFETKADGGRKVVVATDLGHAPDELLPHFIDSDVILLEANYDEELLRWSSRHPRDKARVSGSFGHLSNLQAGRFLSRIAESSRALPSVVALAHLSQDHNRPEVAVEQVSTYLDPTFGGRTQVIAAPRNRPGPTIEI